MQKNFYLIIILFSLTSCYTYQVKKPAAPTTDNRQELKKNSASANNASMQMKSATSELQSLNSQEAPAPINIQEKLAPSKNVKIDVDGRSYKVIVDRWESDSLVVHPVNSPKKTLKFHKNQINSEKIAEKRFSEPLSNLLTFTIYAGIAAGILYLVR
ncbi:hypothetical protein QWZ06_08950 [Chryseobacterium tructae]|uniref:Lipoprotein n=1 Tax=Chryseobacterium tructae TaxID=1037380 RepID=A0ABV7XY50_9FLAO|nr:hypothetical protein [Chryseobacterium tructae]MDN3692385.1 hypothetical protein [Chryseobacterium tructae]